MSAVRSCGVETELSVRFAGGLLGDRESGEEARGITCGQNEGGAGFELDGQVDMVVRKNTEEATCDALRRDA